ncbi:UDP-N-acetylmuramoyl-tripeptide--D-alanyl-D-alanine ligase [Pelotalea chapellei]|uniref:UDP-N-acetylmuramoyl-tripeptide--D-alanyl-D-alanine ligase n=1 Tax=Pelotalea chapellei TaxID=44671 RepID=A0ABS5U8W7_9BACT|nr:UDP-N-acetylmuramoyl-tripeptide--D-alanyl-D-alanine ligase [Pelotalea chapellei]MBT1072083.1 UDP-N-acetylmuramoyl-tripeptide--D-alanyl-D-alanine ligase [Pelotalea chapellei]
MFTIQEIAAATGGIIKGNPAGEITAVSTDSRSIRPGMLFVPLKGERFDGHDFIEMVVSNGIRAIVAEQAPQGISGEDVTVILVPDTLRALGDLALFHRRHFTPTVIGITGSNGKTTTKEMLAAILEQSRPGLKTEGNLNNLIGLPQMLFKLDARHKWAVLEMGMSEPGEIDRLAEIALPQVGIVLNAFPAHLESMGSVENVARAKGELLLRIEADGYAVVNADDALIDAQPSPPHVRRITFGLGTADVRATQVESLGTGGQRFVLHLGETSQTVALQAFGSHNIYNALAAAAGAYAAGVPPQQICSGLNSFKPYDKRFQLETVAGLVLIDDSYNANPASMKAALAALAGLKGGKRAFVALGDMLELGDDEAELHYALGTQAAGVADRLYLYGKLSKHTAEGARAAGMSASEVVCLQDHESITSDILSRAVSGDFILVKGSRGMRMEKIVEGIKRAIL